ncbi:Ig-like protein group 2 [Anaerobacterium chartisolvens]|uniref:Ig-like protein group 2 n=1 Tax=Anaerobacterium chartisolvens TaxID=1297424 RepID=A0A369AGD5_9FIRM|nr:S-layer homology domain-containing protein [Anaerobacterium chartisolvens]RCX08165.1 Ig-like protein group 2 [Anaerobacterium chartisolvens]
MKNYRRIITGIFAAFIALSVITADIGTAYGASGNNNSGAAVSGSINYDNYTQISLTPGEDETKLNLAWYSISAVIGTPQVQIGKKSEVGDSFTTENSTTFDGTYSNAISGYISNKVTVESLEENTEYVYRYGINGSWSERLEYSTERRDRYNFIFVGDPQIGAGSRNSDSQQWNDTMKKAVKMRTDTAFMLSAGDQVNTGSNENEYAGYLSPQELKALPVATTIGNHDANDANYTYHFNNPNTTNYGKTNAGGNYYFSYGDTLFIIINTNNTNAAQHEAHIDEAVKSQPDAKWKVLMFHQDIYGSGNQHSTKAYIIELRNKLFPIIDKYKIDVVLTGHDHSYTRSYQMLHDTPQKTQKEAGINRVIDPTGTVYITANSASGSKYYDLESFTGLYAATRSQYRVPTFSSVTVDNVSFTIDTYRTDTMQMIDHYSIIKKFEKKYLLDLIAEGNEKAAQQHKYEEASFNEFKDALENAKNISSDTGAQEEKTANAYLTLSQAINGLAEKTETPVDSLVEFENKTIWTSATNPYAPSDGKLKTESGNTGTVVAGTFDGAWLGYDNLYFGDQGVNEITIEYASNSSRCAEDGVAQIRADSEDGELLGEIPIPPTAGSWGTFKKVTGPLARRLTGTQSIYVVLKGTTSQSQPFMGNFDNMVFTYNPDIKDPETPVTGIKLEKDKAYIKAGETIILEATVEPKNTTNKNIVWTTSDPQVAAVGTKDSYNPQTGKTSISVTGVGAGSAVVSAVTEDGGYKAECSITVSKAEEPPVSVTGISLDTSSIEITEGSTALLTAAVSPNNAANKTVLFTSSGSGISISDAVYNGDTGKTSVTIKALSSGHALVTAASQDGGFTAVCSVTVKAKSPNPGNNDQKTGSSNNSGTKTNNVPAVVGEGSIRLESGIDANGNAAVEIKPDDIKNASGKSKDNVLSIIISAPENAQKVSVVIPAQEIKGIGEKGIELISFDAGLASLSVTPGALNKKIGTNSKSIVVAVEVVQEEALTEKARAAAGGRTVYEVSIDVDGNKLDTVESGSMNISTKYTLARKESPSKVVAYFIDENGNMKVIKSSKYSQADGSVKFSSEQTGRYVVAYSDVSFKDMGEAEWAREAVDALAAREIVNDAGDDLFSPKRDITRAEFLKIIMNAFYTPDATEKCTFTDVSQDSWYYNEVALAQKLGIIKGNGQNGFGGGTKISRQDMAVIAYRVAQNLNKDLGQNGTVAEFSDKADIASYAADAVKAIQEASVMRGFDGGKFSPGEKATKAQAAVIVYRMYNLIY